MNKLPEKIAYDKDIPLYYQLSSYLKFQIESGKIKPNIKLPSELELCEMYNVSQGTLRQALKKLENEGLIVRKAGKGTFVSERKDNPHLPVEVSLIGFTDDLIAHGKKMEVKVLDIGTASANEIIADFFKINFDQTVTKIERLRSVKNIPIYYVVNYLLPEIGKKIEKRHLLKFTTIEILEKKLKINIDYAVQEIGVTKADHFLAQLLSINVFEPVMNILIRVYENKESPIELVDMYCRADRYKIMVHLNKRNL